MSKEAPKKKDKLLRLIFILTFAAMIILILKLGWELNGVINMHNHLVDYLRETCVCGLN